MGWDVIVYRQRDGNLSPAKAGAFRGPLLAEWHEGIGGLVWLDELVKTGKSLDLGGDGFPLTFTVIAKYAIPQILKEDAFSQKFCGKPAADHVALEQCQLDEWLLVLAYDSG
jgi:hypothetical protein